MENKNLNKLGIDIGSTTVKIAVLGKNNELLFADYERHFANIQETLSSLLQKAYDALGDFTVAPMITVFSDRIEILSRGTIPPGQTMEGFYAGESVPVNQKLSDMLLQLH